MSRSFHSIARRRARNLTETRDWIRLRGAKAESEKQPLDQARGREDPKAEIPGRAAAEETTGLQDYGTTEGEA